jgi:hypothetical protein
MTIRLELPKFQAFDADGNPLSGGLVWTYSAGTDTLKTTYSDYDAQTENANPVVLDSRGEADIYIQGTYKIVLQDSTGSVIWTLDNIQGGVGGDSAGEDYHYPDATAVDQGLTGSSDTVKYSVDTLSSNNGTIYLKHDSGSATTTYTLTTSESIPSTIKLFFEKGAIIDGAGTLTFVSPSQIEASSSQQIFGSTITVVFSNGGEVVPEWWGIDGTSDEVQFQAANNSIASAGGNVILSETTYVLKAPNAITLAGGTKYYAVQPDSGVNWIGRGYNTVVKLDDAQTAGGNDPGLFVTNVAYTDAAYKNIRFDLNGANNAIVSNLNTPAIWVSGDSAYAKNIQITDNWFHNCPGLNFVILGQSNSTGATIGENILIENNKFYQGALDTNVTDHSCVYTWADHVRIANNFFENETTNTNGWRYACGWEFHGSNCIAIGNTVKRFGRGCYLGINYVRDANYQIVDGNTFEMMTLAGVNLFLTGADANDLKDVIISNNTINMHDRNIAAGYGVRADVGTSATTKVYRLSINDNHFVKTGGVDQVKYDIFLQPLNSIEIETVKIRDNIFEGSVVGVYMTTSAGTLNNVDISGNTFLNMKTAGGGTAIGIYTVGATGFDHLKIHNNHFEDNQAVATFTYGINLSGTITNLDVSGNSYNNLTTQNYLESSLTYTSKKINGEWVVEVAAAATGGTATFVVTITIDTTIARTGFVLDLVGNFAVGENIYKRFACTGYLSSDAILDAETSEVFTIGDALKSTLTAGNPVAVGSGNQISITFTNADNTAFEGVLSLTGLTDIINQIVSVTVANNQ